MSVLNVLCILEPFSSRSCLQGAAAPALRLQARRDVRVVRGRGEAFLQMSEGGKRKETRGRRGWVFAGLSLAVLFGVVLLKGSADSGGELD